MDLQHFASFTTRELARNPTGRSRYVNDQPRIACSGATSASYSQARDICWLSVYGWFTEGFDYASRATSWQQHGCRKRRWELLAPVPAVASGFGF